MSLYDRLVPAEALRWGALTRPWDPWADVGPWLVMPIDNTRAFYLERGRYDVQSMVTLTPPDRPSWLPWRKRR